MSWGRNCHHLLQVLPSLGKSACTILQGDVFNWSEKLQDTITDAEIEDYYQRNKRTQFVQTDTGTVESTEPSELTPADIDSDRAIAQPSVGEPSASQLEDSGSTEEATQKPATLESSAANETNPQVPPADEPAADTVEEPEAETSTEQADPKKPAVNQQEAPAQQSTGPTLETAR